MEVSTTATDDADENSDANCNGESDKGPMLDLVRETAHRIVPNACRLMAEFRRLVAIRATAKLIDKAAQSRGKTVVGAVGRLPGAC